MFKSEQLSENTYFNKEKRTLRDNNKYEKIRFGVGSEITRLSEKERENNPLFLLEPRGCLDTEGVLLGKF